MRPGGPGVIENLALEGRFVSPASRRPLRWEPARSLFVSPGGDETFACVAGEIPDLRLGEASPPDDEVVAVRARLERWWRESEASPAPPPAMTVVSPAEERRYWRATRRAELAELVRWGGRGFRRLTQADSMALYRTVSDVYPNAARQLVHVLVDGRVAVSPLLHFKRLSLAPILALIRREGVRSVLDFGCGWGAGSILLKQLAPDLEVWSFDRSPYRALVTQFNLRRLGLVPYRLFVADGSRLPLADGSIDLVVTSHVLEQMREALDPALAEVRRVARRFACHVEPTYRFARWPHRLRMRRLGYPRDIAERAVALGWRLLEHRLASPSWGRTPGELIVLAR